MYHIFYLIFTDFEFIASNLASATVSPSR